VTDVLVGSMRLEVAGDGRPVVFIHGLGATSSSFQPMLTEFSGFRCIRPDLPGSGRSPRPSEPVTMAGLVDAVIELMKAAVGAPAHLIAHSMGTLVAQHVAARAPETLASLTLFGPIGEPSDAARERLRDRARLVRRDGMIAVADVVAAGGLSSGTKETNPLAFAFVRELHLRQEAEGFAQSCEALAGASAADHRAIRHPTTLVAGEDDSVAPPTAAQALADRIKGARLKVLPRCGHWTPLELPRDCSRLALDNIRAAAP
jgi:pimeloyl-ACP methyl ester carboxylesterase